jgi:hypothetical protein
MSADNLDKHQQTGEFVKVVHERNRDALRRAERREATIDTASRRSERIVQGALSTLRRSGVIR